MSTPPEILDEGQLQKPTHEDLKAVAILIKNSDIEHRDFFSLEKFINIMTIEGLDAIGVTLEADTVTYPGLLEGKYVIERRPVAHPDRENRPFVQCLDPEDNHIQIAGDVPAFKLPKIVPGPQPTARFV